MELSTLFIITGTSAVVMAKLAVMAYCVYLIAESFKKPFKKKTFRLSH